MLLHVHWQLIHEEKERHGACIFSCTSELRTDIGICSIVEEGPHVNDILVRGQLTEDVVFILKLLPDLYTEDSYRDNGQITVDCSSV